MAEPARDRAPTAEASTVTARPLLRHGTALRWLERGILLLGPSGAGKSDLALRLVDQGARLVADDLVALRVRDGRLVASPPLAPEPATGAAPAPAHSPALGLLELRGQGIFRLPALAETVLDLALELGATPDRLPDARDLTIAGISLTHYRLDPRSSSATARLRVLLTRERVY
jgi:HPr kinase/phosphorylase